MDPPLRDFYESNQAELLRATIANRSLLGKLAAEDIIQYSQQDILLKYEDAERKTALWEKLICKEKLIEEIATVFEKENQIDVFEILSKFINNRETLVFSECFDLESWDDETCSRVDTELGSSIATECFYYEEVHLPIESHPESSSPESSTHEILEESIVNNYERPSPENSASSPQPESPKDWEGTNLMPPATPLQNTFSHSCPDLARKPQVVFPHGYETEKPLTLGRVSNIRDKYELQFYSYENKSRTEVHAKGKMVVANCSVGFKPPILPEKQSPKTLKQKYLPNPKCRYRGIALIVNVTVFHDGTTRKGAQLDTDRLTCELKELNFSVYEVKDPTRENIFAVIKHLQNQSFNDSDSFLLAVMSHGQDDCWMRTKDHKLLDLWRDIFQQFNNVKCPGLRGKPKIMLVSMCRGETDDFGAVNGHTEQDCFDTKILKVIPTWTDMLVGYSTMDGFKSHRETDKGTWFIQIFCDVLTQYSADLDVESILRVVAERMKIKQSSWHGTKQICPFYNIGFTKRFYFLNSNERGDSDGINVNRD